MAKKSISAKMAKAGQKVDSFFLGLKYGGRGFKRGFLRGFNQKPKRPGSSQRRGMKPHG